MPDLDSTALKIHRDIVVILRYVLKGLSCFVIIRHPHGEPASALGLLSIVGSVVHISGFRMGVLFQHMLDTPDRD